MELDLDLPDLGKIQLSRIDLESFLRIGERVISTYALETGISRLLPGLDTPEEGFERQVHTLMDILEKRAHKNIARAQRTVQQWMMIRAPISLFVKEGTDVFDIPRMIFAAADEMGIKLHVTSMEILVQLRRNEPRLFHKRVLGRDVRIYMKENGETMVEVAE